MSLVDQDIYNVDVLDAKYDSKEQLIVVFALFKELNTNRILIYDLKNMTFNGISPIPEEEANRTVDMFKQLIGKTVKWSILDSPDVKKLSEEEMKNLYKEITKEVDETMDKTVKELKNEDKQLERKIAEIIRKENDMEDKF